MSIVLRLLRSVKTLVVVFFKSTTVMNNQVYPAIDDQRDNITEYDSTDDEEKTLNWAIDLSPRFPMALMDACRVVDFDYNDDDETGSETDSGSYF